MNTFTIRTARPADAEALTWIALAAKAHWGYPAGLMALWRESLTVTPRYIERHDVVVIVAGDEAARFYVIVRHQDRWELDHFWVLPTFMGRGVGRHLFGHAADLLRTAPRGVALEIESNPNAEGLYLRMGARRVGEVTREWDGTVRTLPLLRIEAEHGT